jgi:protein-L-isoaspartate O-methyltransferase
LSSNTHISQQAGFRIPRQRMTERLRDHYRISDPRVLAAMADIPRHLFVPPCR